MGVNRGKQFEGAIKEAIEKCTDVSIDRLMDPQGGYASVGNICDFIVYRFPYEYYFECKSCYGNTLSIHSNDPKNKYGAITNNQWEGLVEKSPIRGVLAGICVWFIDHDVTAFVPIQELVNLKNLGHKSLNIQDLKNGKVDYVPIIGKKKRVLFEYDAEDFFDRLKIKSFLTTLGG